MSLIGPRPDPLDDMDIYTEYQKKKLAVRPGITGYNQAYYRNSVEQNEKFEHDVYYKAKTTINCTNFLEEKNLPKTDLIITSPPYVTSYEYADLHQLSSLWLGYTEDYRDLRKGSIGSICYIGYNGNKRNGAV